jgi:hypothetical protein
MGHLHDKMQTKMKILGLAEKTQKHYLTEMIKFVKFIKFSPDKVTQDHIYRYQALSCE